MISAHQRFRKRPYRAPRDKGRLAAVLRDLGERIDRRDYAALLTCANQLLDSRALTVHEQARVLAQVGDGQFNRGVFQDAAEIYLRSASMCLDHTELWLRPLMGCVIAQLKAGDVERARQMADHMVDIARQKQAAFDVEVQAATKNLKKAGEVPVPRSPPRVRTVASRLGQCFLREGEPALARAYFEEALKDSPRGHCRALQGLARIALSSGDAETALQLAGQSIRVARYGAKSIPSWVILIAARRKAGGWQISQNLIDGLGTAVPSVRARAILTIVRELRRSDMRQWRDVATRWSIAEGAQFPVVEAEIRKMMLSSSKVSRDTIPEKVAAAERLLKTPGLSPSEWLDGAKEFVQRTLEGGATCDIDSIVAQASAKHGASFALRARHSLALSCAVAHRWDVARALLLRNMEEAPVGSDAWGRSVWALARLDTQVGQHAAAAARYRKYYESADSPLRFRLQARLQWIQALFRAGSGLPVEELRKEVRAALADVDSWEVLLDYARQLRAVDTELAFEVFERGRTIASQELTVAAHPDRATDILFKLTRREVYDFGRNVDAYSRWERLDPKARDWLWSERQHFWEYIALLFIAYAGAELPREAEAFATDHMESPATPDIGRILVGVPYGQWLIRKRGRAAEGLELLRSLVRLSPGHRICAQAYYWLALEAYRAGDWDAVRFNTDRIRAVQAAQLESLLAEGLDAKARLLDAAIPIEAHLPRIDTRSEDDRYRDQLTADIRLLGS